MWRHRSAHLVILVMLSLSGCITATTAVPRISGRVVDATGKPAPGAKVSVVSLGPSLRDAAFTRSALLQDRDSHPPGPPLRRSG